MKPTVHVLGIHLPGPKIVLTFGPGDALEKIDIPSPLEKYFRHPIDNSYDQLTYIDYRYRYSVDTRPASCDVDKDVCEPVRFANPSTNSASCIPRSVHPRMHELFALRLLPDLPSNDIPFLEGDRFVLMRDIDTRSGLAKGRRRRAI
jgi:hypothetical protein